MKIEKKYRDILVLLLYACISLLMILFQVRHGRLILMFDWSFHAARVQEIYSNLLNGKLLTFISTRTVQNIGSGTFMFYPTLFLYPWAIIHLFVNSINAYYLWYALMTFICFGVSYLCMRKYNGQRTQAFLFSLLYTGNTYRLGIGQHMIGEFIAASFIPIVFLGFYELFWGNKYRSDWYLLSIGMSLLLWSHLLSAFLCVEIFLLILFFYVVLSPKRKEIFCRLKYLLYSIVLTIALSIGFLYQFFYEINSKRISTTLLKIISNLIPDFSNMIMLSFSNSDYMNTQSIGIALILVALIGWYFVKNDKKNISIYVIGISILVCATTLFPWYLAAKTPLAIVQMPHRYLLFAVLFLSVIGSEILNNFFLNFEMHKWKVVVVSSLVFLVAFMGSQYQYNQKISSYDSQIYLKAAQGKLKTLPLSQVDKTNYDYQFGYKETFGETDYLPKLSISNSKKLNSILNHIGYLDRRRIKLQPISKPNQLIYHINSHINNTIDLPVVVYRGTSVKVNGISHPFSISKRGTVKLNLAKGKNTIIVGYSPKPLFYVSLMINLISVVLLVAWLLRSNY